MCFEEAISLAETVASQQEYEEESKLEIQEKPVTQPGHRLVQSLAFILILEYLESM